MSKKNMKQLIDRAANFQFSKSDESIICSYIKKEIPVDLINFYSSYPNLFQKLEVLLYPHSDKLYIPFVQNSFENAYNFVALLSSYRYVVDNIDLSSFENESSNFINKNDKILCYEKRAAILRAYKHCSNVLQKKISCHGDTLENEKEFPCKTDDHCLDSFLCLPLYDIAQVVGETCNKEFLKEA